MTKVEIWFVSGNFSRSIFADFNQPVAFFLGVVFGFIFKNEMSDFKPPTFIVPLMCLADYSLHKIGLEHFWFG